MCQVMTISNMTQFLKTLQFLILYFKKYHLRHCSLLMPLATNAWFATCRVFLYIFHNANAAGFSDTSKLHHYHGFSIGGGQWEREGVGDELAKVGYTMIGTEKQLLSAH